MQLTATTTGRVSKTFFGKGTNVKVGDPFAVIVHEGDEGRWAVAMTARPE